MEKNKENKELGELWVYDRKEKGQEEEAGTGKGEERRDYKE